jgi:hypothetical protein
MTFIREFIGRDIEELDEYLTHDELYGQDLVRISTTETDRYYFYQMRGEDRENYCVEAYFNENGTVYDIMCNEY